MKILMAIPHYSFNIIGAVRPLLKDIGKGLAKRGRQADVLSLYIDRIWEPKWKKEIFYDDGLKVIRWPSLNPLPRVSGEKMSTAIDRLLADGALRRSMGERGKEIILEKFSLDRIIESLEKIYMKVISLHCKT